MKLFETFQLDSDIADYIEHYIFSDQLPWFYNKDVTFTEEERIAKKITTPRFPGFRWCPIREYQETNSAIQNMSYDLHLHEMYKVTKNTKYKNWDLFRLISWIYFPLSDELANKPHNPHIDTDAEHVVVLYYVNDSDGDNYFYKKENNELEIIHRETPKKGKLILMDGSLIHASSSPSKGLRSTINIVLTKPIE